MRLASCQASLWLDRTTSSVIRVELFPDLCYLWAEHGLLYTNILAMIRSTGDVFSYWNSVRTLSGVATRCLDW